MMKGTFLLLFFSCWMVFCQPIQSIDLQQCFHYILQNECTTVLGDVLIEESEQQDFFDENVSLGVSDVRMIQESCRRPYLSYFCQSVFSSFSCEAASLEEQHCLEEQYCLQVSDLCSDDLQLNCSSSSFSSTISSVSSFNCSEEVREQIHQVKETPIAVETCLDEVKEQIECCPDPFTFDDNDECVVECLQYYYGESLEREVGIVQFTEALCLVFVFLVAVIPLALLTDFRYPNYVLFLGFAAMSLGALFFFWSYFAGGQPSYVCDGNKNYWKAVDIFGRSSKAVVQYSLWTLMVFLSFSHWCVFSFNLFCHSLRDRTSFFDKFITVPVKRSIVLLMEGLCIFLSFGIFLVCLIIGFEENSSSSEAILFPSPVFAFPFAENQVMRNLLRYPLLFLSALSSVFLLTSSILFLKRGKAIFYFQWRSIIAGFVGTTLAIVITFFSFEVSFPLTEIEDYSNCVSSNPRESPAPCKREYDVGADFIFFGFYILTIIPVFIVVLFWTNPLVFFWWKKLLFSREVLTTPPNQNEAE